MSIQIRSLKQIRRVSNQHVSETLARDHGDTWLYIGRAATFDGKHLPSSPLANPMQREPNAPRGSTLDGYRAWLWREMNRADSDDVRRVLVELAELDRDCGEVTLVCWCEQPGPCHGHVIADAVRWLATEAGLRWLANHAC